MAEKASKSAMPVRLIFWKGNGQAVWLKSEIMPEDLAALCRDGRCPCALFGCPLGREGACAETKAKDWRHFFTREAE